MNFSENNVIDQAGIHFLSFRITRELGHICRLNQGPDVGIDAMVEIVSGREAIGAYVALQIKSTSDIDLKKDFTHYVDERHKAYWLAHPIPVVFAVVNYEQGKIWLKQVTVDSLVATDKHWKIEFGDPEEFSTSGSGLFQRLARPNPSDPIMRRLHRIAATLKPYGDSVHIGGQEACAEGLHLMAETTRELQTLRQFAELDRARYGAAVTNAIDGLIAFVNHHEREMSYTLSTDINGM